MDEHEPDEDDARYQNPPRYHGVENAAAMENDDIHPATKRPCECPSCGSAIEWAERKKDGSKIALCLGDCGEWTVIET